jgi:hypothetical protein
MDGDGGVNDVLLFPPYVLKGCFPGFASDFSSSYGVGSSSQSLDSAPLFTDGFCSNSWVCGSLSFWKNCEKK